MPGTSSIREITVTSPLQSILIVDASQNSCFPQSVGEDRKCEEYAEKYSEVGIKCIPVAFESGGGFLQKVGKNLKRFATLTNNRSFQPAGLLLAFNTIPQSVSVTTIRGSAIKILARDA